MRKDIIAMSEKELKKYRVIQSVLDGKTEVKDAAESLALSTRQIMRLKKGVSQDGPEAVIHGNTKRKPHNSLSLETREKILELWASDILTGSNFSHFREILDEVYGVKISYSALHRLLTGEGIKSPKKRRRKKQHKRRKRRPQAGLLVQTDASPYAWFKGNPLHYALHGVIDDATGQVLALYMTKNECLNGYFEMMRRMLEAYGSPVSLYADRHTIFQSPNKGKADVTADIPINDTQFGRALRELNINLIPANSPQAKGRIERLWETLQSRLPIEFALNGITTLAEANEFLLSYIYKYNSCFAVEPEDTDSMFEKVRDLESLKYILCIKETRTVDSGLVFSYKNKSYLLTGINSDFIYKGDKVKVLINDDKVFRCEHNGYLIDVLPYVPPKRKKKAKAMPKKNMSRSVNEGSRKYFGRIQTYIEEESYAEMAKMLDEILSAPY